MLSREIAIVNRLGLHARAASKFVALAAGFKAEIRLCNGTKNVDGKNIMDVMLLAAARGTVLTLTAEGEDAETAINALERLVASRFEETD